MVTKSGQPAIGLGDQNPRTVALKFGTSGCRAQPLRAWKSIEG